MTTSDRFQAHLHSYAPRVEEALAQLERDNVMSRIWVHDHTVWKDEALGIVDRLGWLHAPGVMAKRIESMAKSRDDLLDHGYSHALLLGMGGSSLAPEVLRRIMGTGPLGLDLSVLDSTDPEAVLAKKESLDLAKTVFIVATKSGGTVETLSFFKYFYNRVAARVGAERAGNHFIAITDPGSRLSHLAADLDFRAIFLNDPNIGGRYSAMSYFGMAPAMIMGLEVESLLERAQLAGARCMSQSCEQSGDDDAGRLGATIAVLALAGRDKLTIIAPPRIAPFGDWVEQLIAESTGKEGKGILPVVGEELGAPEDYGDDRLFVHLRLDGDPSQDEAAQALITAGHPLVRLCLEDLYDLGQQFFIWEMATAVAGRVLGINPFDQPNVEAAKVSAREIVAAFQDQGQLPTEKPCLRAGGVQVFGETKGKDLGGVLRNFLLQRVKGAYLAIQAYVNSGPGISTELGALRTALRQTTGLAVTVGYGPRFLHSTGQLHKGDAGKGLFIQITCQGKEDAPIPNKPGSGESVISFGVLKMAQAMGDAQALKEGGRRVIRFHLEDVEAGLALLTQALSAPTQDDLKKEAALAAVELVEPGMVVGLGTGSTAILAVRRIGELHAAGMLPGIKAVATSRGIQAEAEKLGIPMSTLDNDPVVALTIDGADEVDPGLNLIKGGGGALLREKMVAQASRRLVIIVDESKLSERLGANWALPIEVVPFGWECQVRFLQELGAKVKRRMGPDGEPYRTDQGNYILDADFGTLSDLEALDQAINSRVGIVEHGLFLGMATQVIVAGQGGLRFLE